MVDAQHRRLLSDIAIPPGETLRETLDAIDLPQAELARRMGRPQKTINEIVQGKAQITPETAIQLESVLGIPAAFWNNLEKQYRETLAAIEAERALEAQASLAEEFPYAEMATRSWVAETRVRTERVKELLKFFGVANLDLVALNDETAYRVANRGRVSPGALAAWLRRGDIEASLIKTAPFDERALRSSLPGMRSLTLKPPEEFEDALVRLCASAGVALVFVPHLPRTFANGAARWVSPTRALIQLSLRYPYEDVFWFSFFHELGHILLHGKRSRFVDFNHIVADPREGEANTFSAETLIPRDSYSDFVERERLGQTSICKFATSIGVSPGIVVGRLQHDGRLPRTHLNGLRRRFAWVER